MKCVVWGVGLGAGSSEKTKKNEKKPKKRPKKKKKKTFSRKKPMRTGVAAPLRPLAPPAPSPQTLPLVKMDELHSLLVELKMTLADSDETIYDSPSLLARVGLLLQSISDGSAFRVPLIN
jgi:hypothetical protein